MDDADSGLPKVIELMWGLHDRPRRGPKPGLSLEEIVREAVELADAHGLDAVSMSRVAERAGVTTMALYRYVTSKDDLLALMLDAAAVPPPDPPAPGEHWRTGLERWAYDLLERLRQHPWGLRIPISAPPIGPKTLDWLDLGLRSLADTPLTEGEKLSVIMLLNGYVRNEARLSGELTQGTREAQATGEDVTAAYGAAMAKLVTPDRFPALHRMVASGVFNGAEGYTDADFRFGLERLLDGVDVLISAQRP